MDKECEKMLEETERERNNSINIGEYKYKMRLLHDYLYYNGFRDESDAWLAYRAESAAMQLRLYDPCTYREGE